MVIENILPIGTVVQLKSLDARVIVAGYASTTAKNTGYTWDYSGFPFPLGYCGKEAILSFDTDEIESIVSYGYQDEEQLQFMNKLNEVLKEIDKGTK